MKAKDYVQYIGKWFLGYYHDPTSNLGLMPYPVKLTEVCTTIRGANRKRGEMKLLGAVHNFNEETGTILGSTVDRDVDFNPEWLKTPWESGHVKASLEARAALRKRLLIEESSRLYRRVTGKDATSVYRAEMGWSLSLQEWQRIEQHLVDGGWNQWPLLREEKP